MSDNGWDCGGMTVQRDMCMASWEGRCMVDREGTSMVGRAEGMGSRVVLTFLFSWLAHKSFELHLDLFLFALLGGIHLYFPSEVIIFLF